MEHYQIKKLNRYRIVKKLSIFPIIIHSGFDGDFHWTGKWFKWVYIKQQRIKERYTSFDDGWTYQYYWRNWDFKWFFVEFVTKEDFIKK